MNRRYFFIFSGRRRLPLSALLWLRMLGAFLNLLFSYIFLVGIPIAPVMSRAAKWR